MPCWIPRRTASAAFTLFALCACHGGGGSKDDPTPPRSNIDLEVTDLAVVPTTADVETDIVVSGTIRNVGTETANPDPGDRFHVLCNLSKDGTIELVEQGFLNFEVTDPLPPGGAIPFSRNTRLGLGDTLSQFGNFCTGSLGGECVAPETGVLGCKADSAGQINELREDNNFLFVTIDVNGSRIAATWQGCEHGVVGTSSGCDLRVTDLVDTAQATHRPCSGACDATEILFPNDLHREVYATLTVTGCTYSGSGVCSGSWKLTAARPVGGSTVTTEANFTCVAVSPQTSAACSWFWDHIQNVKNCLGGPCDLFGG
jgi:hypothetical protein